MLSLLAWRPRYGGAVARFETRDAIARSRDGASAYDALPLVSKSIPVRSSRDFFSDSLLRLIPYTVYNCSQQEGTRRRETK